MRSRPEPAGGSCALFMSAKFIFTSAACHAGRAEGLVTSATATCLQLLLTLRMSRQNATLELALFMKTSAVDTRCQRDVIGEQFCLWKPAAETATFTLVRVSRNSLVIAVAGATSRQSEAEFTSTYFGRFACWFLPSSSQSSKMHSKQVAFKKTLNCTTVCHPWLKAGRMTQTLFQKGLQPPQHSPNLLPIHGSCHTFSFCNDDSSKTSESPGPQMRNWKSAQNNYLSLI